MTPESPLNSVTLDSWADNIKKALWSFFPNPLLCTLFIFFQIRMGNFFPQAIRSFLFLTWGWNFRLANITGEYFSAAVDYFFFHCQASSCLERIHLAKKGRGQWVAEGRNSMSEKLGVSLARNGGRIYGNSVTQSKNLKLKIKSLVSLSSGCLCVCVHVCVFKVL